MANFEYLPLDVQEELRNTANAIVAPGKGILAADESNGKHQCILFLLLCYFGYLLSLSFNMAYELYIYT